MRQVKLDYISDPGHGWIKCSWSLAVAMGILDKISSHSYTRNGYLFLEEDCDAPVLLDALKSKNIKVIIIDKPCRYRSSKIRSYLRFDRNRPLHMW